jgi:hypothetical protein
MELPHLSSEPLVALVLKPEITYKSLIILLYFWLHNENQVHEYIQYIDCYFSLNKVLATENLQITSFMNFEFFFLVRFRQ